jgi:hypothetical protein
LFVSGAVLVGHNVVLAEVVIRLPGGEGIIRGGDGEIELTHDVASEWGQCLQPWDRYQPLRVGLSEDRLLFGGLLPPGAVSVEAVEATGVRKAVAVGGGAYAVVFEDGEHGDPALGFRDAAGGFVHRPMPGEYAHRPVPDAEEPCPVCGAVEYEEYFPTEGWRAGRGRKGTDSFEPSPLVVCRVCGHEEQAGGIMRLGRDDGVEEDENVRATRLARVQAQAAERWHQNRLMLVGVTFPVYAAEGWPARITGHGSQGDDLTQITVGHAEKLDDSGVVMRPRIEVTTSIDPYQPGELAIARGLFGRVIDSDSSQEPTDGLSSAALTLWFRANRRRRVTASHEAPVGETAITIDGALEPFMTVGTPNVRWVAVRRHHDATITIAVREIDPESLVIAPIADPAARLLGPQPVEP